MKVRTYCKKEESLNARKVIWSLGFPRSLSVLLSLFKRRIEECQAILLKHLVKSPDQIQVRNFQKSPIWLLLHTLFEPELIQLKI